MIRLSTLLLIAAALWTGGLSGCGDREAPKKVDLSRIEKTEEVLSAKPEKGPLRICVGSMITPKQGFVYYRQMLDYIEEKLKREVKYIDKSTYNEVNHLLKLNQIDVAFVCGRPYVDGHDDFGLELLVAPQMYGQSVYYSYIIVPNDSPVKHFAELRGKSFAFTDPMSNTGRLVPAYMLAQMGENPELFFGKHTYTYAHDKSIHIVARGLMDGAAVDSLIWEHINHIQPQLTSKTRIIEKSPPFGIPPIVVSPTMDVETKENLRRIFLDMHQDEKGKNILKSMLIERFVILKDSHYDSIRQMKGFVEKKERLLE